MNMHDDNSVAAFARPGMMWPLRSLAERASLKG
jgi:hypothetical protein